MLEGTSAMPSASISRFTSPLTAASSHYLALANVIVLEPELPAGGALRLKGRSKKSQSVLHSITATDTSVVQAEVTLTMAEEAELLNFQVDPEPMLDLICEQLVDATELCNQVDSEPLRDLDSVRDHLEELETTADAAALLEFQAKSEHGLEMFELTEAGRC